MGLAGLGGGARPASPPPKKKFEFLLAWLDTAIRRGARPQKPPTAALANLRGSDLCRRYAAL